MPLAPLKKNTSRHADDDTNNATLPDSARDTLRDAGLDAAALDDENTLIISSDLDRAGDFGERFLVATPQRLLVLSLPPSEYSGNGKKDKTTTKIELDVPLQSLSDLEIKRMVGATSLEARLQPNGHTNGNANGHSNGHANGAAVIELLRSSKSGTKDLVEAERKIGRMRDGKAKESEAGETASDDEIKRTCQNCGRALSRGSNVCPLCVDRWGAMRRLIGYLIPYKAMAIGNGILSVLAIGLGFVTPIISGTLVNTVFPPEVQKPSQDGARAASELASGVLSLPESRHLLTVFIGIIVVASFFKAIISAVRGRWAAHLGAHVLHDIRADLYTHLQRLSLSYYDKREVGAIMSRVQNDVQMLQNFLLDGLQDLILATLTISAVVGIMLYYSWTLALIVLVPVPFVIFGTTNYWKGLIKLWRRVRHQNAVLSARLADTLGGVRVVRAFAQESREVQRFMGKSGELRDATMGVEQKAAAFYPLIEFIMGLGLPLVWYFGGLQVLGSALPFGTVFTFVMLLGQLYGPIQQLTRLVNYTSRAMTAAERVFEVLDTEPEVQQAADAVPMPYVEGRVEFQNVTFGYDKNRPVLHDVNLVVEPGEMIGLVGHSGAGKSTLINLLMRFYDVDEGALLVDGVDMRRINRADLRSQIGVVLQEPYLFHGTVYENIAYGKHDAEPGEVMAAARAAFAHGFITAFPDGYDTLVGERGTRLSGGERQRISIARAILHNPRILILDEATASVDTQTEGEIQRALLNLVKGRTTFAIAHRLSTLRHADRLLVLDGGRIVEQGTHDELLEKRGVFYKLVEAQKQMSQITAIGG